MLKTEIILYKFAENQISSVGSKNKLKRFKENETFSNVIQPTREELTEAHFQYKGKWNAEFFKNDQPIVLELGCGKGEYSVGLAQAFPEPKFAFFAFYKYRFVENWIAFQVLKKHHESFKY